VRPGTGREAGLGHAGSDLFNAATMFGFTRTSCPSSREAGEGETGNRSRGWPGPCRERRACRLIRSREMIKSLQACAYRFVGRGAAENNYVPDSGVFVVTELVFAR
jgi:hypothetical protein